MNRPIRRSALMGPWGVGAVVPFPNSELLMIAGLDMWRYNDPFPFIIKDARLQRRLGVSELRWPPDFRERNSDPVNYNLKIPTVRFPTWYYCPFCGSMHQVSFYSTGTQPECDCFQWETGRKCNPKSRFRNKLIPERFLVVCPDGHIDDFPVAEWLHEGSGRVYREDTCRIRRSTGGVSSALTSVFYECTCGAKQSMAGATRPKALSRINYRCRGSKPWLGIKRDEKDYCGKEDVSVLLTGATNIWFANTVSSINIPIEDETGNRRIIGILQNEFEVIKNSRINGEWNMEIISYIANNKKVDKDKLYEAIIGYDKKTDKLLDVTENTSEEEYRLAEYDVLIKSSGSVLQDFYSINHPISDYDPVIRVFFKSISLVPKLRETRAFIGFSRLEPVETDIRNQKKLLRTGRENWLPAIEVYGEGIFFEFDKKAISLWAQKNNVQKRIEKLNRAYQNSGFGGKKSGDLRPEFVMIHTFAHLLINQLSYECGYGSSSIRERIYIEKMTSNHDMNGVLIYTASGDSEGSLGGLVRQGKSGRLEDTIISAMKNAFWCSSDPICIQSGGQGPESCNLAACHNCALLPETSCENGNRLLDRGLVIGTLTEQDLGFFSDIRSL